MMLQTFASDSCAIAYLQTLCDFSYKLDDGNCVEISFHNENYVFGGTLRKNPSKRKIIEIVGNMPNLKSLNLRKCKLGILPPICSTSLEYLDISCNDLESVPVWVTQQHSLKFLNLGANKLKEVPDLSNLPLETLKLHKNLISKMPPIRSDIKNLNLYLNPFKDIPKIVPQLTNLEVFSFGVTEVAELPNLFTLENLRWLTLTVNKIKIIPDDICLLPKLEGLQLAKNQILELPDNIGNLNVKHLSIYKNQLSKLPDSFYNLKLSKLNLEKNNLSDVEKSRIKQQFDGIGLLKI